MLDNKKMSPLEVMEAYLAKTDPNKLAKMVQHYSSLPSNGPTFSQYLDTFGEVFEDEFSIYFKMPGANSKPCSGSYYGFSLKDPFLNKPFISKTAPPKRSAKSDNLKDPSKEGLFFFSFRKIYFKKNETI